jgi:hypothetical protein
MVPLTMNVPRISGMGLGGGVFLCGCIDHGFQLPLFLKLIFYMFVLQFQVHPHGLKSLLHPLNETSYTINLKGSNSLCLVKLSQTTSSA